MIKVAERKMTKTKDKLQEKFKQKITFVMYKKNQLEKGYK